MVLLGMDGQCAVADLTVRFLMTTTACRRDSSFVEVPVCAAFKSSSAKRSVSPQEAWQDALGNAL